MPAGKLTEKQEAACQAYIECGGNQSEAYRTAYNAENMTSKTVWEEACRLFADPKVSARVLELQEIHRERHNVTVDSITKELDAAKTIAEEERQPAAMTGAILGKAKLHGLMIEKRETKGTLDINLSNLSDEELEAIRDGSA